MNDYDNYSPWYYLRDVVNNVEIENGVTNIGNRAFFDFPYLRSITIPHSVTSIGTDAFGACPGLSSITIPNTVTSIGQNAFGTGLISIAVEEGNTIYDSRDNCNAIIETKSNTLIAGCWGTVIPNSVTSIGAYAFEGSSINSITIPNSVTNIGAHAFENSDISSIIIPNSVTTIGEYAFKSCRALESISIPNSVTTIGAYAFSESVLNSISIPNSVRSIGEHAFYYCTNIRSITISSSVTSIGRNAFDLIYNLASITVEEGNTKYDSRNNCNAIIETATNTLILGCVNTIIPNSIENIGNNAFSWRANKTITLPNSVKSIGDFAFSYSSLKSITIPNSVIRIGRGAFSNTTFYARQPDGLVYLGSVLYSYKGDMPVNTNISVKEGTKGIAGGAFAGYSNLTSITIPNSVTNIGTEAFRNCSGLVSVTIPNAVTSIGDFTFNNCINLSSVTIPNSVTDIGNRVFWNCHNLTSITLPNSVTSIGSYVFEGSGLTSITCEANIPPTCGFRCFYDLNKSIPVYVPANSVEKYKAADGWIEFTNIQPIVSAETYTVTLDHNKGNGDPEQITVTYNQPMPENIGLVAPTRTGFEFTGYLRNGIYYYDANLKSVRNFDKQGDYTLYANWKARTTSVTLDPQGGQNGTTQVTATYAKAMPTGENVVAPTRAGYTFGGYFSSVNGKGTQYYNADMTSKRNWNKEAEEMTLYAKWTPDVFVTDIAISEAAMDLWIGKTKTLTANVAPANATITAVTWTSSNTAVATVSSNGVVKAIAKGTATITCKATDGSGISKSCTVTVKQPVTSIALSVNDATLWVGKAKTVTATVSPTTATKTSVTWSSSDDQVATVSTRGVIKATGRGTCIITCTAADGYGTKAECEVTVKQQVTSIDFGYETLSITCGTTKTLTPTIYPSNANVQKLTWKSKNTSVARVSSEGVLTAVAPGTAQIICTATDGFKKADTITVEVVPLKITDTKSTIAEGTYGIGGISYSRTLTAGKYASFCLPYTVNLNDYTEEFSKVFVPMGMTFLKTNGTLVVAFKKVSLTETISAGKPFVALAAKSGSVSIVNDVKKIVTTLTDPTPTNIDVYNWNGSNGFFEFNPDVTTKIGGTYSKLTGLDSEKYYTVSTSGTMSKSASISPYRIYVYKDDNNSNAKITEIIFSFDEDEMATGIEEHQIKNDESPVYYNLSGQRINKSNAQKGVYIKNGKKYAK